MRSDCFTYCMHVYHADVAGGADGHGGARGGLQPQAGPAHAHHLPVRLASLHTQVLTLLRLGCVI